MWVYLVFARGSFWRIQQPKPLHSEPAAKPVAVVIPARDEAPVISKAITSLLCQDYAGDIRLFLVDDHSSDGTAALAERTAAEAKAGDRLELIHAAPLRRGWTGKLWAISEGLKRAQQLNPDYFLFTDADIVHARDNIRTLVARAETGGLDLASLMVRLHCRSVAERALIPAFVYFFFQLYPPRWIASSRHGTAGAAGGCMLIRSRALREIGGIEALRHELIDDCALARRVKQNAKIWLGTTESTHSVREYRTFGEIFRMISRTAFHQLRHSALWLTATVLGMIIVYLLPPLLLLSGDPAAAACGLAAWMLMSITYIPMLRFYRQPLIWAPLLPGIALFYLTATIHSALRYWAGRGGMWKGRVQDARQG